MNAPHDPADGEEPLDETSLSLLIRLDEALRRGDDLGSTLATTQVKESSVSAGQFAAAALCLLQLEAAFPRGFESAAGQPELPQAIGRFQISKLLGSGGFGLVYQGWDPQLQRTVAVKVPRHHVCVSPELRERFVREAHAAAQLDHPTIVPIYEAGEFEGLPYIAYAFCDGPTLSRWVGDQQELMAPRQAAELIHRLTEAIAYSHSRNILHRDIKPSNVLLFPLSTSLDSTLPFTPKLTDFGLAKLLESNMEETASALMLGTPSFMSPEQAHGGDVGAASDVYSLGATLYFLLTGRPPLVSNRMTELLRQLAEHDPVEPKRLNPDTAADLNTICMKCLEKSPGRRYSTAQDLADDLQRYLAGRPIQAHPISSVYRLRRWCLRKPAVALLTACVCALAIGLITTLSLNSYRLSSLSMQLEERNERLSQSVADLDRSLKIADEHRKVAQRNELTARQLLYVTDVQAASGAHARRDYSSAAKLLNRHPHASDVVEFSARYLNAKLPAVSQEKINLGAQIWRLSRSHSGKLLAVADAQGKVHIVDIQSQLTRKLTWDTGQREVNSAVFSPDDQYIATAGDDGRVGLWQTATGQLVRWFEAFDNKPVFGVAFIEHGSQIIACGNTPELVKWDADTSELLQRQTTGHVRGIEAFSVSPDGQIIATVGYDQTMRTFRTDNLEMIYEVSSGSDLGVVEFDPTGQFILAGDKSFTLHVWEASQGKLRFTHQLADRVCALTVGVNGEFCTADTGGVIHLFSANLYRTANASADGDSNSIRVRVIDDRRPAGLVFDAKAEAIYTGNSKGDLEKWSCEASHQNSHLSSPQMSDAWRPILMTAAPEFYWFTGSSLQRWNLATERPHKTWPVDDRVVAYSIDRELVLLATEEGRYHYSRLDQLAKTSWLNFGIENKVDKVRLLSNEQRAIVGLSNGDLVVFDLTKRRVLATFLNRGYFDVSVDQRWLVCGKGGTNELEVIDLATLQSAITRPAHQSSIWGVAFNADGTQLLTCSGDRSVKIWSTHDWQCTATLLGHTSSAWAGAFSPDGRTLATAEESGKIIMWHAASAQKLMDLSLTGSIKSLDFSADGQSLVVCTDYRHVHILRAE